uniref:Alpha N-terminal protein methyltransferase 1 n=1 Tax=Elaeis guineensis var. tenera TaxID=51953 RepID=A0A8N4EQK2_ELAGV|nr:alpha N-terminal protein methyltransferase 1 isoform X2 [Elaeis guineensis]
MDAGGLDSDGRGFSSAKEMWREEIGIGEAKDGSKRHEWYRKGIAYWQAVEASVDGVLGGYGHVNEADVKGSAAFLNTLLPNRFGTERRHLVALDCGSGIGRVTKNLLLRFFNEVDLVEPVSHFLESARENLALDGDSENDAHKAVNFYCVPLQVIFFLLHIVIQFCVFVILPWKINCLFVQEFTPEVGRYDVIWIQWCIGQLPDDDFISFFKRAKAGLKPNGLFVVKENIASNGFVLDKEDHSITRSDLYFKQLFNQCGLYIYSTKDQKGFPEEIFAVKMYALVTEKPKGVSNGRSKRQRHKPALIKS